MAISGQIFLKNNRFSTQIDISLLNKSQNVPLQNPSAKFWQCLRHGLYNSFSESGAKTTQTACANE